MSWPKLKKGVDAAAHVRSPVSRGPGSGSGSGPGLEPLVDPHWGDVGDDIASPKQRSLLKIAASLVVEISLTKLVVAWAALLVIPAVLLGVVPLVASAWLAMVSRQVVRFTEIGAAIAGLVLIAIGTIAWRPLLRLGEANFWSLNALAVQPGYVFCREALCHVAERMLREPATRTRARVRAASALVAGLLLCGCAILIVSLVWPASRWMGAVIDLASPHRLIIPTLANATVLLSGYIALAAVVWGCSDANMEQPVELAAFDRAPAAGTRTWRIAHLSDLHVVGQRYGFRIESGRGGARGNDRLESILAHLEALDGIQSLDFVLMCGDLTDAGLATEWAEFLDAVRRHPRLATRMVVVPGNHDLNILDRDNPARLDLPLSIGKRLRQMRTLVAMAAVQGNRVWVVDPGSGRLTRTLDQALEPHRSGIAAFMDKGGLRRALRLRNLFDDLFPMIVPANSPDGLSIAILNSNAETHFSFTNALGVISYAQARRLAAVGAAYPQARWIIALHHHLVEYPASVVGFSERIGTALVNGSWVVRKLMPFAARTIVMHGHRHIDWIGACGDLRIISAPSPVMGAPDGEPTHFKIHTLAAGREGRLHLLAPESVRIGAVEGAPCQAGRSDPTAIPDGH